MSRTPTIRYRCPAIDGPPMVGTIIMGDGPRVRRGYRVLSATKAKSMMIGLGLCTWRLTVEPMSADLAKDEISAGSPWWHIVWDKRRKRSA